MKISSRIAHFGARFFLIAGVSISIIACSRDSVSTDAKAATETPSALKEKTVLGKEFYSTRRDLLRSLYIDAVEKSPDLQRLESALSTSKEDAQQLKEDFSVFDSKSNGYYASANLASAEITDSLLRKKIQAIITRSEKNYAGKSAEWRSLLKLMNRNDLTIEDHYTVLQLVVTLPMIEKYQENSMPAKKPVKDHLSGQRRLKNQVDSLSNLE